LEIKINILIKREKITAQRQAKYERSNYNNILKAAVKGKQKHRIRPFDEPGEMKNTFERD
jgi:hypothetical protein